MGLLSRRLRADAANGDCPAPQLCVKSEAKGDAGSAADAGTINVCQLPAELKCVYNSNCTSPLICARDQQCRNQCVMDVDCVSPQVCTGSKVCALTCWLVQGTNDVKVVTAGLDASGATGSGATGTGGSAGEAGAGGAATGTGGTARPTKLGRGQGNRWRDRRRRDQRAAGSTGGCPIACGVGKQCVTGTCQDCGASAEVCCGGSTPCGSYLVCSSANSCTCGAVSQPCCGGTSCSPGLSCLNGVCSCGGAGQNCCTGTTGKSCSTGLTCGGLKCGCTAACDQSAAMKTDGSIWLNNTPVTNIDASLFKAAQFSYNGTFACAVKTDGTVWCWGNSTYGTSAGVGVAALATGVVLLVTGHSALNSANDNLTTVDQSFVRGDNGVCDQSQNVDPAMCAALLANANQRVSDANTRIVVGYVVGGVGVAAAVVGAVVLLTGDDPGRYDRKSASSGRPTLMGWATGSSGGRAAVLRRSAADDCGRADASSYFAVTCTAVRRFWARQKSESFAG